jgi:hypothetical protein
MKHLSKFFIALLLSQTLAQPAQATLGFGFYESNSL